MNGRERYFKTINFPVALRQWSHSPDNGSMNNRKTGLSILSMVKGRTFSLEEVGIQVHIPAWQLPVFFLSSFFYPLAFYCLFSLPTLLASRDFCENVFLVRLILVYDYLVFYVHLL